MSLPRFARVFLEIFQNWWICYVNLVIFFGWYGVMIVDCNAHAEE